MDNILWDGSWKFRKKQEKMMPKTTVILFLGINTDQKLNKVKQKTTQRIWIFQASFSQVFIINQFMIKETELGALKSIATLAGAGFAMTLANPFDLVRIRMQTMAELLEMGTLQRSYEGIIDCMSRIVHEEGLTAFWKGNSANLMRFYGSETVNFFSKETIKETLKSTPLAPVQNNFFMNFLSGVLGSWVSLAILYPIEHARNHQSINFSKTRTSVIQNILETASNKGFKSLYTGSMISMYGVAMFRGTYFGVFDTFKGDKTGFERWSVAYLSSLLAIMLTYPSDTIRRRLICSHKLNQKYSGFSDCSFKVYRREGLKSFYRGYPIIFFQGLTSSIILFLYDTVTQDLKKHSFSD